MQGDREAGRHDENGVGCPPIYCRLDVTPIVCFHGLRAISIRIDCRLEMARAESSDRALSRSGTRRSQEHREESVPLKPYCVFNFQRAIDSRPARAANLRSRHRELRLRTTVAGYHRGELRRDWLEGQKRYRCTKRLYISWHDITRGASCRVDTVAVEAGAFAECAAPTALGFAVGQFPSPSGLGYLVTRLRRLFMSPGCALLEKMRGAHLC